MVAHALSPARVTSVEIVDAEARSARVVVPDYQLSLAIGKEGQNARLAARLTGWRIDIRSDEAEPDARGASPSTGADEPLERATRRRDGDAERSTTARASADVDAVRHRERVERLDSDGESARSSRDR